MAPTQSSNGPNNKTINIDIGIGIAIILVGAIIYIGRLLYKRRRRRKDLESDLGSIIEMEEMGIKTPPKKTAANHLDELKEATQKVLQPLRRNSSILTPKLSLEKSSNSSDGMKYSNRTISSMPYRKVPPPPPPSPLKIDDIKADPIRMSMLNLLLSGTSKTIENSVNSVNSLKISSPTQSRRISRRASRRASRVKSRVASRASSQSSLRTRSKKDLTPPQTASQLDLVLPSEIRLKKNLTPPPRKTPQLDLTPPSETRLKRVLIPPPQITSQLDLKLPSKTSSKRDLTPSPPLIPSSKIRSKRSNRKLRSHYLSNKETNDYTNFQPIQNIKPIKSDQTVQKKMTLAEITETGELTLSPMYKAGSKENQDDEVILDATLE